jgi:hypothetical protein
MLAGEPPTPQSPATSVAVYQLCRHKRRYYYHFMESKTPEDFDVTIKEF